MKPDVQKVMVNSFERIMTDVAPHITSEYAIGSAAVIGLMAFQTAAEFERGAEIRVQENVAFREIFSDAAGHLEESDLCRRLQAAAGSSDTCLLISALDKTNDELSALLIELQTHIELLDTAWARTLEAQIWNVLGRAAEARRLPHPMVAE